MQVYEYDEVDPLEVLHLNLLCLDFALTPDYAAALRRLDPRPFACLAVYAKVRGRVAGQVGVFRLPVVSVAGAQEVGGVWAVATHPAHARQGIASHLLNEAHTRMRRAGLHFSTLGTQRHRAAYSLYRRLGYEDIFSSSSMVSRAATLPRQTVLRAEQAGSARIALADQLFEQVARDHLGFARRHTPFFASLQARGECAADDLWLLWHGSDLLGYAVARKSKTVLRLDNLLLLRRVDPVAAVAALAHELDAPYISVRVDRPADEARFTRAGFLAAQPGWSVFMVKPLAPDATVDHFRHQYGVTTGRFLMSYLDIT